MTTQKLVNPTKMNQNKNSSK